MTSQRRYFIELSDILAWRFECKKCHASLQLALSELQQGALYTCPNCNSDWALIGSDPVTKSNHEAHFRKFLDALNDLKRLTTGEQSFLGFTMTLEIKEPSA